MRRREFLRSTAILGLGCSLLPTGCWFTAKPKKRKKVLVLGVDGMDTHLTRVYMRQGLLQNFKKLADRGSMRTMASSFPPQSPVAWSNFIVGASSEIHGIYDFIHRDPQTMLPYLSTSRVIPPNKSFNLGGLTVPLSGGHTENLRKGKPFWDYLAERDIPTTIFKVPANFPCESEKVDMVSGMGTPDLRGGYGSFTVFTNTPESFQNEMTGGKVIPIVFQGQKVSTELSGPPNTFRKGSPETRIPIEIWRDRNHPLVRILIQDKEFLLKQGEWTGWLQLSFPLLGSYVDVKGICKIYIKSVHPEFAMYVSPINIDPSNPALPVVSSKRYGNELVRNTGYFYTQGLPDDTKALSEGVLSEKEYLELAKQTLDERRKLLRYELYRFSKLDTGVLFFYISSLDQNTHMYWRSVDKSHPLYDEELNRRYGGTIRRLYAEMDGILGEILYQNDMNDPNLCLIVLSDHGFAPFRREVNVNTWLFENGYLDLSDSKDFENDGYFENVNWARTSAYSVGINAIYLNVRQREKYGTLTLGQSERVCMEIRRNLLKLIDPKTGKRAVSNIRVVPEAERRLNPHAPDLIIGWNLGYRTSWNSILGGFSRDVFSDNRDKWSGDHCIDPSLVPAVLFSNKKITKKDPNLCDMSPTILEEFGIPRSDEMRGQLLYRI